MSTVNTSSDADATSVAIIGAVSGNGGDAAILLATVRAAERASDRPLVFDVVDSNPEVTRRIVPQVRDVTTSATRPAPPRQPRWRRRAQRVLQRAHLVPAAVATDATELPGEQALAIIERADVVVYTGGTSLVEHYELGSKYGAMRAALLADRPLVLATQSLGPFRRELNQERMRVICRRATSVLLRDQRSLRHLEDIGAPTGEAEVLPDIVFALAELTERRPFTPGARPLRVAVSVRSWGAFTTRSAREGNRSYIEAVSHLVSWLVRERGAEVTFLSTCQGVPTYWTDDSECAATIVDGLAADVRAAVTLRRDNVLPEALRDEYGTFDLVVATRMHAAILALCAGTPVVGIAYEFKTTELLQGMGLGDLVADIEDVDGEKLVAMTEDLLSRHAEVSQVVASGVEERADQALIAGARIVNAVKR